MPDSDKTPTTIFGLHCKTLARDLAEQSERQYGSPGEWAYWFSVTATPRLIDFAELVAGRFPDLAIQADDDSTWPIWYNERSLTPQPPEPLDPTYAREFNCRNGRFWVHLKYPHASEGTIGFEVTPQTLDRLLDCISDWAVFKSISMVRDGVKRPPTPKLSGEAKALAALAEMASSDGRKAIRRSDIAKRIHMNVRSLTKGRMPTLAKALATFNSNDCRTGGIVTGGHVDRVVDTDFNQIDDYIDRQ